MLKVVGEAQGLNVLLQTRRHVPLIARKPLSCQFRAHPCEEGLDFSQFALGARRSMVADVVVGLCRIVCNNAVEEEDDLFGEIRDIATGLWRASGTYTELVTTYGP